MAISLYVDRPSALHRRHPVAKVVAMILLFVAIFVSDDPRVVAPITVLILVAIAAAGAFGTLWRLRWLIVPIFVFTTVIWAVFYPAQTAGAASRADAVRFGLGMALKLESFLLTGLLFLATTTVEEFAFGLTRLGVPYRAGFVLTLACRLVPVFLDAALTVVDAQRCRGLDLTTGSVRTRIARYVPVIVPVFIGGLRRADQMAFALEVRGFSSGRPRTELPRAPFGAADAVVLLVAAGVTALYLWLWAHGIGRLVSRA
jgi:energy-coupling factor transport system permease protein